jgi:hypothetical protein
MKKEAWKWLAEYGLSFVCLIIAGIMACTGQHGWGWFLFASLLLVTKFS